MNNKIIEVLNYLGEKIGLFIDWTAENIYPQVVDFMGRYRAYAILVDAIWILIGLGCCFGFCLYIKKAVMPARVKCLEEGRDNFWYEYNCYLKSSWTNANDGGTILTIVLGVITTVMFVGLCVNLSDIIKWIIVPESQFYETIKSLLS